MPIKIFDSKEDVPEAQRDAAIETKDGKFAVSEDDVAKLTSALGKERERAKEEAQARKEAEKERDELRRAKDARDRGISEEEMQKIRDAEKQARKPIEEERDKYKAENRKLKLTDRVQALYLKSGGMPDRVEDAMLVLERRTELTDADGIAVKDKDGNVTSETIDDFLKVTFRKERPWLYAGTGASGGGSSGSSGESPDDLPVRPKDEQVTEKRVLVSAAL